MNKLISTEPILMKKTLPTILGLATIFIILLGILQIKVEPYLIAFAIIPVGLFFFFIYFCKTLADKVYDCGDHLKILINNQEKVIYFRDISEFTFEGQLLSIDSIPKIIIYTNNNDRISFLPVNKKSKELLNMKPDFFNDLEKRIMKAQ